MTSPLLPDRMVSALSDEGIDLHEYKTWRTNNRNHKGAWGGVNGVVIHHTASSDSQNIVELCYTGRSDLPGPLCHAVLRKDGSLFLVGNGRANHAGMFAQNAHNAVVGELSTHPRPASAESVDGNAHYYGLEIANLGNGNDPYPEAQYDAAVRWASAICRAHGWSANSVIGHKEGTRRKIDPSFDMDVFRDAVSARLAHSADWDSSEEDELTITAEDIAKAVWNYQLTSPTAADGTDALRAAGTFLRYTDAKQQALLARLAALEAAVAALATGSGLTAEQVTAAAEAGAVAALRQLGSVLAAS